MKAYKIDNEDHRTTLFLSVLDCLWRYNDAEKRAIAEEAGCSWVTLYNWCSGKTTHPRIDTLTNVGRALGFQIVLKRDTAIPKPERGLRRVK